MPWVVVAALLLAACGRIGFEPAWVEVDTPIEGTPVERPDAGPQDAGSVDTVEPYDAGEAPAPRYHAYRLRSAVTVDPHHFYRGILGCLDVTDDVNSRRQAELDVLAHSTLLMVREGNTALALVPDVPCEVDGADTWCRAPGRVEERAVARHDAPCEVVAAYEGVPALPAPCFSSAPRDEVVVFPTVSMLFRNRAWTFRESDDGELTGFVRGTLREDAARAARYDSTADEFAGQTVFSTLAAAQAEGASCASHDDRDLSDGALGFTFSVRFTAEPVQLR